MMIPMPRMSSSTVTKMKPSAALRRPPGIGEAVTAPPRSDASAIGWAGMEGGSAMRSYTRAGTRGQLGLKLLTGWAAYLACHRLRRTPFTASPNCWSRGRPDAATPQLVIFTLATTAWNSAFMAVLMSPLASTLKYNPEEAQACMLVAIVSLGGFPVHGLSQDWSGWAT